MTTRWALALMLVISIVARPGAAAAGEWEITPESERAVELGLEWLAKNQGAAGNWESNDLGLVALGALAFMSAGHTPGKGKYGDHCQRAIDFVVSNAKPSGLINIGAEGRDMYNHGLATFVLTQVYGQTDDKRVGKVVDRAIKLIFDVQAENGGWDYKAVKLKKGHDLSLAVMQAKALRGAMDMGLDIPPRNVQQAIAYVRRLYKPTGGPDGKARLYGDHPLAARPGRFTYSGRRSSTAMAAAGVVCLQEFGQYGDFRIFRSIDAVIDDMKKMDVKKGDVPFDAYTLYYVSQGLYQVGGKRWEDNYPKLRDAIIKSQRIRTGYPKEHGGWDAGKHVGGLPGRLFGTAAAVYALTIPNRYLPILQQGVEEPELMKQQSREDSAAPAGEPETDA